MKRVRDSSSDAHGEVKCGSATRVEHDTIDWEVRNGGKILGIRDREIRTRVHAICDHFADGFAKPMREVMKGKTWDRASLCVGMTKLVGDQVPVDELIAAMPDKWVATGSFEMRRKERRLFGDFVVNHLVESIAIAFCAGPLVENDMIDHAMHLTFWFSMLKDIDAIHLTALQACVPRMLFDVEVGTATPLVTYGQSDRVVSTIDAAVRVLSVRRRGVVRLTVPDPTSRWCCVWTPDATSENLSVQIDKPIRSALLTLVGTHLTQDNYDALMTGGGKERGSIAIHKIFNNRRFPPGSKVSVGTVDVMGCISHELADIYHTNPAFDQRPQEAIVDAVIQETHAALFSGGDQRAVIDSWMAGGLCIPRGEDLNNVLDLVPTMRVDMHLATVVALLADNSERTRIIQDQNCTIMAQNCVIMGQLAEEKEARIRAEARSISAEAQIAQITQLVGVLHGVTLATLQTMPSQALLAEQTNISPAVMADTIQATPVTVPRDLPARTNESSLATTTTLEEMFARAFAYVGATVPDASGQVRTVSAADKILTSDIHIHLEKYAIKRNAPIPKGQHGPILKRLGATQTTISIPGQTQKRAWAGIRAIN